MRSLSLSLLFFLSLLLFALSAPAQTNDLDAQNVKVYHTATVLTSRMTVLSIALQPGFEDLRALTYLRFVRGTKIVSAYVTNGEGGHSDMQEIMPGELAFRKRAEAYETLKQLEGLEYFFNFPDFGSLGDTSIVASRWDADSLQDRVIDLIELFRPDLVILPPDRQEEGGRSIRWTVLRDIVLKAVAQAGRPKTASGFVRPRAWSVGRVVAASKATQTVTFPVSQQVPLRSITCIQLAEQIGATYRSMQFQRAGWTKDEVRYEVLVPKKIRSISAADELLPGRVDENLKWIDSEVRKLSSFAIGASEDRAIRSRKSAILKWITILMDSVDTRLSGWGVYSNMTRKTLLHWKEGLEELRNTVFGVKVDFTMKDTVLIGRQLTSLRIHKVNGMDPKGTAELFFPDVGKRWILNEDMQQRVPLVVGQDYRLVSPTEIDLSLPATYGGRGLSIHGTSLEFFLIYQTGSRNERFFKKVSQRILYAPRLTVEPLTPLVRAVDGEYVVFRFSNHSNDGLLDTVVVRDSVASTLPHILRLPSKESTVVDTFYLSWQDNLEDGTYRIPLSIGSAVTGYFAARKLDVDVESSRRIAIVPSLPASPLTEALRRLRLRPRIIASRETMSATLHTTDIVVLDERAFLLRPWVVDSLRTFVDFVSDGGTLVILSQEADSWNRSPLSGYIHLKPTTHLGPEMEIVGDSSQSLLSKPNVLAPLDWAGWLFSRSENVASAEEMNSKVIVRFGADRIPGVIEWKSGKGKIVYVNLSLGHQLMNIQPGSLRFLSNLLSQ